MKDLRILIVEDELIIAESHKDKLLSFGVGAIEIAPTVQMAYELLKSFRPSLVLLDVRLEGQFEGIEVGEFIGSSYHLPFIYLTAHSDLETIRKMVVTNPVGYISKPVRKPELFATVNLALNQINASHSRMSEINDGTSVIRFRKEELKFAQSQGNYISLNFSDGKRRLIRNTLDTLSEKLDDFHFQRVNRSYLVNLDFVEVIDRKQLFIDNAAISLSRTNYDQIMLLLQQLRK